MKYLVILTCILVSLVLCNAYHLFNVAKLEPNICIKVEIPTSGVLSYEVASNDGTYFNVYVVDNFKSCASILYQPDISFINKMYVYLSKSKYKSISAFMQVKKIIKDPYYTPEDIKRMTSDEHIMPLYVKKRMKTGKSKLNLMLILDGLNIIGYLYIYNKK